MDVDVSGGNSGAAASSTPAPSVASPATQPQSAAESAAPAVQGTQAPGITDHPEREGFIPRARFDEVNTRMSAAEKALQDYRTQHGWAESVQRDQLEQMAQWYSRYNGDAGEFMENILQESLQHPVHGASVKSRLGRMLAALRQQQSQPDKIEAGIPVMNDKGDIVARTYTDAQMEQLLQQKLDAALSPFKEDLESRKTQAQKAQEKAQIEAKADADVAYVKKRPGFEKYKKDILDAFNANPQFSLRDAYDHVMDTKLPAEADAKVRSDLQHKALAQTVSPSAPSGSAAPQFKSFKEAHDYYSQHPEEAAAMAQR